ncbi:hypothetical protein [Nocardiopsis salina]|uniref:hypothetical protein n=1 Tax=Nocardiopsis salina TaxID=245836 RepID=UPI00035DC700|nr:hypothetical protein [Nocardiopsis salina]
MSGDPWILVHDFSAGAQALLHLELEYLPEQECLLVHGIDPESGEVSYSGVPVWPEGVQPLDEDADADEGAGVHVPDHGPLVDGDTFTAGGAPGAEEEPPEGVDPSELGPEQGCDGEGYVVLNADSISEGAEL